MEGEAPGRGRWVSEPFTMGTPEEFERLRQMLHRIGFTAEGICGVAGIASIYELKALRSRTTSFTEIVDAQSLAVQLFIDGEQVPWSTMESTLWPADLKTLQALGLIQKSRLNPELCAATVALYPSEGLYIASDRHWAIEAVADGVPADIVYSAITPETHRFIELMPSWECESYLELCSGTGIAALIAARDFAAHAWAVDITDRSTQFAEFNAALNGLSAFTALQGDLYAPVAGKTFDLITAHPPYVPSFETEMVYRDGGEDGEQITRAIIRGLAAHLNPGGQFYCDCTMTDRTNAPLEYRIREMLGPDEQEFDVLLAQTSIRNPLELYAPGIRSGRTSPEAFTKRQEAFKRLQIEQFVGATFVIQRRAFPRTVVTRRRIVSGDTTASDFQWYLFWAAASAQWPPDEMTARLLASRPLCSPRTELRSRAVCRDGTWSVVAASIATRAPFATEADCAPWFGGLLARCDGQATAADHLSYFRDLGMIPPSSSDAHFARLIGELADGGFIELDLFPLPDETMQRTPVGGADQ